ncbi:hypothetical protein ACI2TX_22395, partial [Ralstonia nicotianae]
MAGWRWVAEASGRPFDERCGGSGCQGNRHMPQHKMTRWARPSKSPFENSPPLWCKGGMWKKEDREREAKLARKTKRYPSDLTDI